MAKGWKRRVLKVLVDYGMLNGERLAEEQQNFDKENRGNPSKRQFLQLKLNSAARRGQPENVNQVNFHSVLQAFGRV